MERVERVQLEGHEAWRRYVEALPAAPAAPVYFYFSGSKLPSGRSWCDDCVVAEPVVNAYLTEIKENITFVYVNVGDREYWKDKNCPFRTDPRTKLLVIPTIIRWKGVQRLEGSQCNKRELLEMLFTDEE